MILRRYHFILIGGMAFVLSASAYLALRHRASLETLASAPTTSLQEIVPDPVRPAPAVKKTRPSALPDSGRKAPSPAAPTPDFAPKLAALTFDDGPHPEYTERLLAILKDENVQATFFVVGKQVERHPELAQRIFQEGHELANHTFNHPDLRRLSPQAVQEELEKTEAVVASITEQHMRFFRPPGGQYNREVQETAADLGYAMALWTVLPQDHARPESQVILDRVLKGISNNGVILLHSGVENTLAALPEMIRDLKAQGYQFVTLSQMEDRRKAQASSIIRLARSLP
jgi:peptidoglycan/xylan/chitin deacetylase (PgdA/CDA1 family)